MDFDLQPFLESNLVVVRPLQVLDFVALYKVASDPLIWEQHQNKDRHTKENFTQFFNEAIDSKGALVILDKKNEEVIGSSRFKIIDVRNRIVEIGWSFLGRDYWGGPYNRAFKKLMVNHALQSFDKVVFYVNSNNYRSQKALEKLGAMKMIDTDKSWILPKEKGVTFVIDSELK